MEKWRKLSEEQRRAYDVIFFNEIEIWNLNSNRYAPGRSHIERRAEFERMASAGYLPAYTALRLAGIWPAELMHDPAALELLLAEARRGDPSAMCAVVATPKKDTLWSEDVRRSTSRQMMIEGARRGHGACMAYYGGALLLGNIPEIKQDAIVGKAMVLQAALEGYYAAASRLYALRNLKTHTKEFDFTDRRETMRALCWGRLAEQHTNWSLFDGFLSRLRDYAKANNRPDVARQADCFGPRCEPITEVVVKPELCAALEKEE